MTAPVVVITPTVGTPHLAKAMESVNDQPCEHWIVIDGEEHAQKVADILKAGDYVNKKIILLPENTGRPKSHWSRETDLTYNGHRIYASIPHLVNADHVMFLDEDNWFEPNHVESMLQIMNARGGQQWCYSLRRCVREDGSFLCNDDCDSLGIFASWKNICFVDMSCYCFKTGFLMKIIQTLQNPSYNADRHLYRQAVAASKDYDSYASTGLYTVNYRLRKESEEFFIQGNAHMRNLYSGDFPWTVKNVKLS